MSETVLKKDKASKKGIDVTDAKVTDPSSRAIIVGSGQLMENPTLTEDNEDSEVSEKQKTLPQHEIRIEPISNEEDIKPEVKDELPKEEKIPTEVEKPNEVAVNDDQNTRPAEEKQSSSAPPSQSEASDETSEEVPDKQQQAQADAAILERLEKVGQMITSEKYFLPINMVERRRDKKIVTIGIVIALILILAWVDVALDAGLIHNFLHLPHTHFFALKS